MKIIRLFQIPLFLFTFFTQVQAEGLTGNVKLDGSSTVFPISEAMAEEFQKVNPHVRVTVGISGTGGGFKKFTVGEIDIADASRPITEKEREIATKNKIEFVELPIAIDGIAVIVNPKNSFVDYLTVEELKKIWEPGSQVQLWSDVRPSWPKEKIRLYGPGTDSGTYDYFTEEIVGKAHASRSDFSPSEDDNVLVKGIEGDPYSLGYFGFAYYEENRTQLKLIPIQAKGGKPILPSKETIKLGTYKPLARPIFIYANKSSLMRKEVMDFVRFYLNNATKYVPQVGYVPFTKNIYDLASLRLEQKLLGTTFGIMPPEKRWNIAELLKMPGK